MPDGQPSRTARSVAGYRLGFERPPAPFGDPEADDLLASDVLKGADFVPEERMARYLRGRTSFFDRVVLNGLERGSTQVAVIGAGYDGRAVRYAKPGVRWFEVDHPVTQRDKRQRLSRLEIQTPGITFVAADFVADDVAVTLMRAGFQPDAPSLLLCEGVAVYLAPAVLAGLLAQLRSLATAGTRLAVSGTLPAADPVRREHFAAQVANVGEPIALGATDVRELLLAARWRTAELSERAQRVGMFVGLPVWEPGLPPTAARVGAYLERTFHRVGLNSLTTHLSRSYGIEITATHPLDVGVLRVDQADGSTWVARVFPAARPQAAARGDAEILCYLADAGYPAERLACPDAVSEHEGQAVLVTEFVPGKAPPETRTSFHRLGDLLGRLHTLPNAPSRAGGAWHHLAFTGGPEAEIGALQALLAARSHVPEEWRPAIASLRTEVDQLDDLQDLPTAFTHPDFVPANAVAAPNGPSVIVDWAGAGIGPRLWTLAFLLWSAGHAGPLHVDAVAHAYRQHIELEPAELDRLIPALTARPLIFDAWAYATGRGRLADIVAGRAERQANARAISARAHAALKRA